MVLMRIFSNKCWNDATIISCYIGLTGFVQNDFKTTTGSSILNFLNTK